MNILQAMNDPNLFGAHFSGDTWARHRALIGGFYGLPLDDQQAEHYTELTQRQPQQAAFDELWLVMGRRAGKSHTAALLAVYEAFFNDYTDKLAAGEVASVFVICVDRKAARSVFRYIQGMIEASPMLRTMVVKDTNESIELSNRCTIEIMTASFKAIRGYSVACAILDECAFYSDSGANPDREIIAAIKPSLATLGGKLIALSSPYARRGVLWDAYKKHFAGDSQRVLVAQAPTQLMNPLLPPEVIAEAYEDDPASAAAEYGAEFRKDVETFIDRDVVEAAVIPDRLELPPSKHQKYFGFVDPSGGSKDAFTMAIAHRDSDKVVIDAIRSRKPPFSPEAVVEEFCTLLKSYRIHQVTGDRYAGEWPREQFSKRGVLYKPASKTKSELYRDMLPLLNSYRIELPDDGQLVKELCNLERKTARGGRDIIDHAPGSHDDLINAVAGGIDLAHLPVMGLVWA